MKKFNGKLLFSAIAAVFTLVVAGPASSVAATSPTLGPVGSYSVLGHTTVTNTGPTTMPGDLGISIGGAPTGFPPGSVGPPGTVRNAGDSLAAQTADTAAFLALSAAPNATCDITYADSPHELTGATLTPGIYCANAFQLTGTLYLDDLGDSNAVWIFRSASTLNTSAGVGASVQLTAGSDDEILGSPCNVWWKVVSSATIGSGTTFIGNILALTSIDLGTGASLNGRALAQTGAVTLHNNTFTGSSCLTTSTFTGGGSVTGVTPKLPNTGSGSEQNTASLWAIGISSGIIVALLSFIFVQRKRVI